MSTITINGRKFEGSNVSIIDGVVIIDGLKDGDRFSGVVRVEVTGNLVSLKADAPVVVKGNVGSVEADGPVSCGNVTGNVETDGPVTCGHVSGNVKGNMVMHS
jgi:hypothetical protein